MFPHGFFRVPLAIADRLHQKHEIVRGCQVTSICSSSSSSSSNGGGDGVVSVHSLHHGEFRADAVVVTVPLGVLQHGSIRFVPALPQRKLRAIRRMGNGLFNKIALRFDAVFWDDSLHYLGYNHWPPAEQKKQQDKEDGGEKQQDTRNNLWFINLHAATGAPMLLALVTGDLAVRMQAWPDTRVTAYAVNALRAMHPSVPSEKIVARHTLLSRWGRDPFARGSYTYMRQGSTPADFDTLAEPVLGARLFFAGEATSRDRFGYTDGAFDSGRREAARIAKLFDEGKLAANSSNSSGSSCRNRIKTKISSRL
jgi:lysine-specific histone demethylase 1